MECEHALHEPVGIRLVHVERSVVPHVADEDKSNPNRLVEVADAVATPFALLFKVKGDKKDRLNVFYNVTAERPKGEDKTAEDKLSVTTETMPITMIPAEIGGRRVTKLSIEPTEANASVIAGFYDEVYEPVFGSQAA